MSNEIALTAAGNRFEIQPVYTQENAVALRKSILAYVRNVMVKGVDYGIIPGTDKPCLFKSGAEKLITFFGVSPTFEIVSKIEDWTGDDHKGEQFFFYHYKCIISRGDHRIAEAEGSCNSMESRYRWRWVNEADVPGYLDKSRLSKRNGTLSEPAFAIDKAQTGGKWGKPIEYWNQFKDAISAGTARRVQKKMGQQFQDCWEIGGTSYRVPNDDIASLTNTIMKMAQKRAEVAVVLLGLGGSEIFTQDIEDMDIASMDVKVRAPSAPLAQIWSDGVGVSITDDSPYRPVGTPSTETPPAHEAEFRDAPPEPIADPPLTQEPEHDRPVQAPVGSEPEHDPSDETGNVTEPARLTLGGSIKAKLDPAILKNEKAYRLVYCTECGGIVAEVNFEKNGGMIYNRDGKAHPAFCAKSADGLKNHPTGWEG